MAVVNSIAERIEGTRIIIKTALIRNNKMAKDIEERKIMHAEKYCISDIVNLKNGKK